MGSSTMSMNFNKSSMKELFSVIDYYTNLKQNPVIRVMCQKVS